MSYNITYDANGGENAPAAQIKTAGIELILSSDVPTRTGYTFGGWQITPDYGKPMYDAGGTFYQDADTTLYALWETVTYTITYDANGGTTNDPYYQYQTKIYGEALTLYSNIPTRTGYVFIGWATSSSAANPTYTAGGTFTTDADTTLYAVWSAVATYTITYDANGGVNAPAAQIKTYSVAMTLNSGIPTKTGAVFMGWATTSSAAKPTYTAGDNTFAIDADATIYAVWCSGGHGIAAGENHSLMLKDDGTVWAWGDNTYGQLGDSTLTKRLSPVQVSSIGNIIALSAGSGYSMALRNDGTVWSWGYNNYGQLGDGTTVNRFSPVQVSGLNSITAISAGSYHSMALRNDGTVWVWGHNNYGQLGTYTVANSSKPMQIYALNSIIALAAGSDHSLALRSNGTVWSCGRNNYGQLGNGTTSTFSMQLPDLNDITAITAGENHSMALQNDGTVWAWGLNDCGQLGDGTTVNRFSPVHVPDLSGVTAIAGGWAHSMALHEDGTVRTWGTNEHGQLGDGTTVNRFSPVQAPGLSNITALAAGGTHSMAMQGDGTIWTWGENTYGALGDGTTTAHLSPFIVILGVYTITYDANGGINAPAAQTKTYGVTLAISSDVPTKTGCVFMGWATTSSSTYSAYYAGGTFTANANTSLYAVWDVALDNGDPGIVVLSAGSSHSMILKNEGTVWAWGDNSKGELGDGTITNRILPVQVHNLSKITAISGGALYSIALKNDGTVWSWGYNSAGQLGNGTSTNYYSPIQVFGVSSIVAISAKSNHSMALKSDGTVWTWGSNNYSQLGDGTTTNRTSPAQVPGLSDIIAISAGYYHSMALKRDGTVWAWGANGSGQLGDGTTTNRTSPVQVPNLSDVTAIEAGCYHSMALKNDGTVWTCGSNSYGQIGDGSTNGTTRTLPVKVPNLSGVIAIAAGCYHSMTLKSDGIVWVWGDNDHGELGDGGTTRHTLPVQVPDLNGVTCIAAGQYHSMALQINGMVWTWGYNNAGQLGDSTTTNRLAPVYTGIGILKNVTTYTITYNANGGVNAPVPQTKFAGIALDIAYNAPTKAGYVFLGWATTSDAADPAYEAGSTFTANADTTLYAVWYYWQGKSAIAAGNQHSMMLNSDGYVLTWGWNYYGSLGDGTTVNRTLPWQVLNLSSIIAISAGSSHGMALKKIDGTVWVWGADGSATISKLPVQVPNLSDIIAIAAGNNYSLVLKNDGTVWAWGANGSGQLGDGSTTNHTLPVQVPNLNGIIAIAAGTSHSMALKNDGTIWTWGDNSTGQLGDGTTVNRTLPGQVPNLNGIIAIAASSDHTMALKSDSTVWTWGDNNFGQLGDSSVTSRTLPGQVPNLSDVTMIATGNYHSIALKTDTTVWTWGYNSFGQLGDGSTTLRRSPGQVPNLSGIIGIAVGQYHSMALENDDTVWAWGYNASGQLGDGTNTNRLSPVCIIYGTESTHTITYNANGGAGAPAAQTKTKGTALTLSSIIPTKAGYAFMGWATTSGSTVPMYYAGETFIKDADTILYAVWDNALSLNASDMPKQTIAAGSNFTIRLRPDGNLWAWGRNNCGQLGDGTTSDKLIPVQVSGLTDAASAAAGVGHAVALKSDGTVWAWGSNSSGQVGNGTSTDQLTPAQVGGLTDIVSVAAGDFSTYSLKYDGTVWAWGQNTYGQLGDGTSTDKSTPVQVDELTDIVSVAAGNANTYALKSDGTVWAWGNNNYGQLGDGTTTNRLTPVRVSWLTSVVAISAGYYHAAALKSDGTVWTWGQNTYSQLGDGTTTSKLAPVQVSGLTDVVAITTGSYHSVALKSDGTLWAWGQGNYGQIGDGMASNRSISVQVKGLTEIISVMAGSYHNIALKSDGTIWAWGQNTYGQFGDGTTLSRSLPIEAAFIINYNANGGVGAPDVQTKKLNVALNLSSVVPTRAGYIFWGWATSPNATIPVYLAGETFTANADTTLYAVWNAILNLNASDMPKQTITAGLYSTFQLKSDGTVWAWGYNYSGQLGDGTTIKRSVPVRVSGLTDVVSVSALSSHTVVLKSDSTVWVWGNNQYGQLGDGTTTNKLTPVQVSGLTNIVSVAAGDRSTYALKSDGTVWAWGNNTFGQVGDSTTTDKSSPVKVSGLTDVVSVAAGYCSAYALKADGTVWAWGYNGNGELGDGTTTSKSTPVRVSGLAGVVSVAAGFSNAYALRTDGTVWAWGYNNYGQLGNGTTTNKSTPVQVSGLTGIVSVATGNYYTIALKSDGTVWAWGNNGSGQLGDGTTTSKLIPAQVNGLGLASVVSVAAGYYHTVVLESDGTLLLWGDNLAGQLGDGTTISRLLPECIIIGTGATTYTITYNANGGENAPTSQTKTDGIALYLSSVTPTRAGYVFLGWATSSDATVPAYCADGAFTANADTTLYAVWDNKTYYMPKQTIAAGYKYTIRLKSDGTVWTCGDNTYGQLGDGTTTNRSVPVQVSGLTGVVSVATRYYHTIVLKSDGTVWTCGYNFSGQLGDGTTTNRSTLAQVKGLTDVASIAGGYSHTIALRSDGTVWVWGSSPIGDGTTALKLTPVKVSGLANIVAVSAGYFYSLALQSDGTVWGWGDNLYGGQNGPVKVNGFNSLTGVVSVAAGGNYAIALKHDGTIWAWGNNGSGQLGDGFTSDQYFPVQVSGLTNVVSVAAGGYHTLAMKNDGTVWVWGSNYHGQLGDGTTISKFTPIQLSGLTGVVSLAGAEEYTIALKSDGTFWAWGNNQYSQFGDGTVTSQLLPKHVINYTITYNANGGVGAPLAQAKAEGIALTLSSVVPAKTGYAFMGWATTSDANVPVYAAGGTFTEDTDATLYAVWRVTYTIAYNANGGANAPAAQTKIDDIALTLSSAVPTRTGYAFMGWATTANATVPVYSPGGTFTANANTTLYAVWNVVYTITYDANGGAGAPAGQIATGGAALTLSAGIPTRAGYVFLGWATTASATAPIYSAGETCTANASFTLYAVWGCVISYDANGGAGAPVAQTKANGAALTLSNDVPTQTGYVFLGWATTPSAMVSEYSTGGTYTTNANLTLYAVWGHTITYNANGGAGAPAAQTTADGAALTLSAVIPARTGDVFMGWATTANATASEYSAGDMFTTNANTTLYAVWEIIGDGTPNAPYLITTKEQLAGMWNNLGACYKLGADIDLADTPWTPIGTFTGGFDGNGYTIKNLSATNMSGGLFGSTSGATLQNIIIENAALESVGSAVQGVIAAAITGGTVDNCQIKGNISIKSNQISQSYGGYGHLGALAGVVTNASVTNCTVSGILSIMQYIYNSFYASVGYIGGFAGRISGASSVIDNCTVTGDVQISAYTAGGFAGEADNNCTIKNSRVTASGLINGDGSISYGVGYGTGGFIGNNSGTQLENCSSAIDVESITCAGGLVGNNSGPITLCYATGNVYADSQYAGGLAGYSDTTAEMSQCYATGDVAASSGSGTCAGGLIGGLRFSSWPTEHHVTNCFYIGNVSGYNSVGGLVGDITGSPIYAGDDATIVNCYVVGQVTANNASKRIQYNFALYEEDTTANCYYYDPSKPNASAYILSPFSYSSLDFTNTWTIQSGVTCPYLQGLPVPDKAIKVTVPPVDQTLAAPVNVTASDITATTVTLSWTGQATAQSYDIAYNGQTENCTGTPITIQELIPNTQYTFNVRAVNETMTSGWSTLPVTVTTLAGPTTPAGGSRDGNLLITLNGANVPDNQTEAYTFTYDPNQGTLVDLAAQTGPQDVAPGNIADTDLTITSISDGVVKFTVNKSGPSGMAYSGVLTIAEIKPLGAGPLNAQCQMG